MGIQKRFQRRNRSKPHSNKPSATAEGTIGQGVGRLPTAHSTPHIAKEPLPIGGLTTKGQRKVLDSQGKIRFIDMKVGRVLDPVSGVPIKP